MERRLAELLLTEGNTLEGPRRVTTTIRPIRCAYLVHPTDPAVALAAVEAACLQWGGKAQFLIPCAPGAAPDPMWQRVVDRFDPDVFVDLVGASADYTTGSGRTVALLPAKAGAAITPAINDPITSVFIRLLPGAFRLPLTFSKRRNTPPAGTSVTQRTARRALRPLSSL